MHAKRFIIGIGGACSKFSSNKIHSFNKIISVLLKYILIALLYVPMTLPKCISWYMQVNSSQFIVIEDSSYVSNKMNRDKCSMLYMKISGAPKFLGAAKKCGYIQAKLWELFNNLAKIGDAHDFCAPPRPSTEKCTLLAFFCNNISIT